MIKVFYGMPQLEVDRYAKIKTDILVARSGMDAISIQAAKTEVMKECTVNDYDPENTGSLYSVKDGVASIPIAGMLVNKVDFCAAFYGETITTYKFIQESAMKANSDPAVKEIVFDVNSGGGVVGGVDETSQIIKALDKPTKAIVRDMAASAAYWLASATDEILIASNAGFLGSIGVAVEVVNRDKADEKGGISRRTLTNTTSSDKRPNLETEDGQAVLIKELDDIFGVFAESILEKRSDKLSMESIQALCGKVIIAKDAIDYGLADGMCTIDSNNKHVVQLVNGNTPQSAEVKNMEEDMDLKEYLNQNPSAKAEYDDAIKAAKAEGTGDLKADRERSAKITKLYGNSEMAVNAIGDGTSVGDLAVAEKEGAIEAAKKAGENKENNLGKVVATNVLPEGEKKQPEEAKKAVASQVSAYLKGAKK